MTRAHRWYDSAPVWGALLLLLLGGLLTAGRLPETSGPHQLNFIGSLPAAGREEIRRLATEEMRGDWTLAGLRGRILALDWVRDARLRYLFDGRVQVEVLPLVPVAAWNLNLCLDSAGKVFRAACADESGLPALFGPDDAVVEVMSRYREVTRVLAPLGQELRRLGRDAHGRWSFETRDGVSVRLGYEDIPQRLDRYRLAIEQLERDGGLRRPRTVDARYGNGVAVTWREAQGRTLARGRHPDAPGPGVHFQ